MHEEPFAQRERGGDIQLAAGMVITIEPGLYVEGRFGIRHENTLIITEKGGESLYP